ncbi:MAG: lantibiotic dehydratase [Jatrophihabitantaceae bacterium]
MITAGRAARITEPTNVCWDIAPYAMARFNPVLATAGGSQHHELLAEIRELRATRAQLRQSVLDELYALTPTVTDELRRRVVLPTSRAVFNDRLPRASAEELTGLTEQAPELRRWLALVQREQHSQHLLTDAVAVALDADRQRLQQILGSREFLLAAGITSPDMARAAQRYAETPLAQHNKRVRKSEAKLSRYAERAATKTSPFSHFTVVAVAEWTSTATAPAAIDRTVSRVEPNLLLVVRLLDAALHDHELAEVTAFRVRPELRHTERGYEFEVMRDEPERSRIYQGRRAKVAIGKSSSVELLFAVLDGVGGSATLGELAAALAERSAQPLPIEAVRGYLAKLREAGLLVPSLRVDQQADHPALVLAAELGKLAGHAAARLADQLRSLHQETVRIGQLAGLARAEAVDGLRTAWEQAFQSWGAQSRFDSPLYEDVALSAPVAIGLDRWRRVHTDLTELLSALEPLNMDHPGQVLMRLMMVDRYGPGGRCSYQDFVALLPDVFTAERVSLASILEVVAGRDPDLTRLLELREQYLAAVNAEPDAAEVVLEPALIRRLASQTPAKFNRSHASVSAFLQPVSQLGDELGGELDSVVLNAALDGHGQFLSRFLELWDGQWIERVRAHLRASQPAGSTELRPVQGFNANVHPAMLDAEFTLPERHDSTTAADSSGAADSSSAVDSAAAATVDPRELTVLHDPATDRLRLLDRLGNPVHPRYLGFLVPYLLPWELTGLYLLSQPSQLRIDSANELERRITEPDSVRHYPRVRYGSIILNRQRWYVPAAAFPQQQPEETPTEFLIRLDGWRAAHGIPARVFLIRLDGATTESQELGRPKPMYADLQSPLHLRCLPAWLDGTEIVRLDEALPDPAAGTLLDPAFGQHVCEYLVECSRGVAAGQAPAGQAPVRQEPVGQEPVGQAAAGQGIA